MKRIVGFAALVLLGLPQIADAKSFALRSPTGRTIYDSDETVARLLDQDRRHFVIEVAVGAGPEGNLGIVAGWLMPAIKGLEIYAGVGVESNPAIHYTLSARYLMNIGGFRPYVGAGYLLNNLYAIGTISQNVFGEVGYSWKIRHTYHLTLGVGFRYLLHVGLSEDSPLDSPVVDPVFRDEQIASVTPWLPTIALRFSRAF